MIELKETTQNTSFERITDSILEYCEDKGYGLAIWTLPHSEIRHLLVCYSPIKTRTEKLESLKSGFVINAFETQTGGEKIYLEADVYFTFTDNVELNNKIKEVFSDFILNPIEKNHEIHLPKVTEAEQQDYLELISKAVSEINKGNFKKLVLARKKTASVSGKISPGKILENALKKYKNTFNSISFTPEYGTWLGASPETLVCRNADQIFKTVALAGTQHAEGKSEKEAAWSQKEIEEQAYVSKFIVERLKKIRLREFEDIGPKTVRIGHLFHLKTEFIVDLKEVEFPDLVSDMLEMLHPTSAVCGMPKEEAMEFVLANENFSRELYSGYLGPVNIGHETHIFVNLRCIKIKGSEVSFYAGAGITEDSVPQKEFTETEYKMESLLNCF